MTALGFAIFFFVTAGSVALYAIYCEGQIRGYKKGRVDGYSAATTQLGPVLKFPAQDAPAPAAAVREKKYQAAADCSDCHSAADMLMQVVDALDAKEGAVGETYLIEAHPFKDRCIVVAARLERLGSRLRGAE